VISHESSANILSKNRLIFWCIQDEREAEEGHVRWEPFDGDMRTMRPMTDGPDMASVLFVV